MTTIKDEPPPWVRLGICPRCQRAETARVLLTAGPQAGRRLCLACAPPLAPAPNVLAVVAP